MLIEMIMNYYIIINSWGGREIPCSPLPPRMKMKPCMEKDDFEEFGCF